jgi:hypothetical protein
MFIEILENCCAFLPTAIGVFLHIITCLDTFDTNLSRVLVSVTNNVVAAYEAGLWYSSFTITLTTTTSTLAYLLREDAT